MKPSVMLMAIFPVFLVGKLGALLGAVGVQLLAGEFA